MEFLIFSASFYVLVLAIRQLLDLFAHVYRYREEIRKYPATKSIRGKVWWSTKDR